MATPSYFILHSSSLLAVPFVHPGIAGLALLAGLIPILVHLINRRRYVRVPWAAMSFLLAANRRSARRIRLEQSLLLLTRIAAVILLGLAVARPFLPASPLWPSPSSRVHRVLLLDNSLSMSARRTGGVTRFESARRCARDLLDSFPPTDAVSIVTLSYPAEAVIAQTAYDRRFVKERLAALQPTQRGTDTVGGLTTAIEILEASRVARGNYAVYLISDFPRAVWAGETPENPTPAVLAMRRIADMLTDSAVDLTVVHAAPGPSDNLAVTRFAAESPLIGINLPVSVAAVVTNNGSLSANNLTLQIRRDGQIIRRQQLPRLDPGEFTVAAITTEFSIPGTHLMEARLAPHPEDVLEHDDTRYLSLEVRETMPVLMVDGRPGTTQFAGQVGFLATALAPAPQGTGSTLIVPKVITEPELSAEALPDYDVVALCNVSRLPGELWKQLESFVARGGGLLVFGGDLVSVDNYNQFAYAGGDGLLPGRIARPVLVPSQDATFFGFKVSDAVHSIVADFADHPESGLFSSRVERYVPIELDPHRAEVVLSYTNDEPALLASTFGKGRVLLCTTTANMDWNNLAAKGDYVSLMLSAMAFLSPRHGDYRNVTVGQMIREPLTPLESSLPLRVKTGEGALAEPSLVPEGEALTMTYGPVEHSQAVTVSIGSEVRVFTVNVDPAESDLAPIGQSELATALNRDVHLISDTDVVPRAPVTARSTELASSALYLVIGLLLLEMWMAMRFGSQRNVVPASRR